MLVNMENITMNEFNESTISFENIYAENTEIEKSFFTEKSLSNIRISGYDDNKLKRKELNDIIIDQKDKIQKQENLIESLREIIKLAENDSISKSKNKNESKNEIKDVIEKLNEIIGMKRDEKNGDCDNDNDSNNDDDSIDNDQSEDEIYIYDDAFSSDETEINDDEEEEEKLEKEKNQIIILTKALKKSNEKILSQKFEIEELEKLLISFRVLVKKLSFSESNELIEMKKELMINNTIIIELKNKNCYLNQLLESQKDVVCSELSMNSVIRLTANNLVLSKSHRVEGFQNILSSIHHKERSFHEVESEIDVCKTVFFDEIPACQEMIGKDILDSEFEFDFSFNSNNNSTSQFLLKDEIKNDNRDENDEKMILERVNNCPPHSDENDKNNNNEEKINNYQLHNKKDNEMRILEEILVEELSSDMNIYEMTCYEVDKIKFDSFQALDIAAQGEVVKEVVEATTEKTMMEEVSTKIDNPDLVVRALIKRNVGSFRGMTRASIGAGRGSFNIRKEGAGTGQISGQGVDKVFSSYSDSGDGQTDSFATIYKNKEMEEDDKRISLNGFNDKNNSNFINIYKDKLTTQGKEIKKEIKKDKIDTKEKRKGKYGQKIVFGNGQKDKLPSNQVAKQIFLPKSPYSKKSTGAVNIFSISKNSTEKNGMRDENENYEDKENSKNTENVMENNHQKKESKNMKNNNQNSIEKAVSTVRATGIATLKRRRTMGSPGKIGL